MEVRNYRKFRHASLELPDGVVGILGSNGSGKSTLMEAVAWALYGNEKSITRDGRKEGVRSSFAGMNDDCSVLLEFEIAGDHYRLLRTMKGKAQTMEAQLSVNGMQLARTDKGVTDEIRRILGMDYKSFFISVFARQKELNALSSLGAAERGKIVRRMLGIESLTKTVEEIDRDRKAIQDRLFGMQQDLLTLDGGKRSKATKAELEALALTKAVAEAELSGTEKALSVVQQEVAEAMTRREALSVLEELYAKVQAERLANRKDLEATRTNGANMAKRISELEAKREDLKGLELDHTTYERLLQRKEALESQAQSYERRRFLDQQRSDAEAKLAKARSELQDKERMASACIDSKRRLQTVEDSISSTTEERDAFRERSKLLEADIKRLSIEAGPKAKKLEEVKRLGPESACPTCERKLCDQHSFLVTKLEMELSELSEEAQKAKAELASSKQELDQRVQRLDVLEKRRKELRTKCEEEVRTQEAVRASSDKVSSMEEELGRISKALASIQVEGYSPEEHSEVKSRIQQLRPSWERYRALMVELEALPRWQEELSSSIRRASELEAAEARIDADIASLGYKEGERRKAQSELDSLLERRETLSAQVARADKSLERARAEESAKRAVLVDLERRDLRLRVDAPDDEIEVVAE